MPHFLHVKGLGVVERKAGFCGVVQATLLSLFVWMAVLASPAVEAAPPGKPSFGRFDIYSGTLAVYWGLPEDGGLPRPEFRVQWKSRDQVYDAPRQLVVTHYGMSAIITGLIDGTEYTVRVIASNADGEGPPSTDWTATPGPKVDQFRKYLEDELVEEHGNTFPWLREVWNYIEDQWVRLRVTTEVGGSVRSHCNSKVDGLDYCRARELRIDTAIVDSDDAAKKYIVSHELAHIATLANDVVASPVPFALAHLYFDTVPCSVKVSAAELYADTLASLVAGSSTNDMPLYWRRCTSNDILLREAQSVVRSAVSGQVPSWFAATYNKADGKPDLDRVWADVRASGETVVIYALRNSFGGYCESSKSRLSREVTKNPWRDGGCVPGIPRSIAIASGGNGRLIVSWESPESIGASEVKGYRLQWKSGDQAYEASRQMDVGNTTSHLLSTISGLTNGTEHTIRVQAYNHDGDGDWSGEVVATPAADDTTPPKATEGSVAAKGRVGGWRGSGRPDGGSCCRRLSHCRFLTPRHVPVSGCRSPESAKKWGDCRFVRVGHELRRVGSVSIDRHCSTEGPTAGVQR